MQSDKLDAVVFTTLVGQPKSFILLKHPTTSTGNIRALPNVRDGRETKGNSEENRCCLIRRIDKETSENLNVLALLTERKMHMLTETLDSRRLLTRFAARHFGYKPLGSRFSLGI